MIEHAAMVEDMEDDPRMVRLHKMECTPSLQAQLNLAWHFAALSLAASKDCSALWCSIALPAERKFLPARRFLPANSSLQTWNSTLFSLHVCLAYAQMHR